MPVQEPLGSYTEVDPNGVLGISSDIITATAFPMRSLPATYVYDDKGVGGIADGYTYRTYFEMSAIGVQTVLAMNMSGNAIQDRRQFYLGSPDQSGIYIHKPSGYTWNVEHNYGPSQIEVATKAFAFILNNRYAVDLTRSGQNLIGNLYDIDGGHGTPGALVDTQTLVCAQTLLDHQYLYAIASSADGGSTNTFSGTVELWNQAIDDETGSFGSLFVELCGKVW